jgi:hypothetical protein
MITTFRQDVRAQHDGVIAGERANQLPGLDDLLGVEARGGLVEHQDVGIVNQRLREADPLLVALRELRAMPARHVGHPGALHHLVHAASDIFAHALDLGDEGQVLADGHVRIKRRGFRQVAGPALGFERLLEHVETGDGRRALGGGHVAGNNAHRRGLPGAVGAEKPENFAGLRSKTHVVYGGHGAVAFGKMLNLDHGRSPINEISVSSRPSAMKARQPPILIEPSKGGKILIS